MARKGFPSDKADQFNVRMPPGLRDKMAKIAEASGRSMNAEIVSRLEQSLAMDEKVMASINKDDPLKGIVTICEGIIRGASAAAMLALDAGIKSGQVKIVEDEDDQPE